VPPPGDAEGRRVSALMAAEGVDGYRELLRRSVAEPEWFYGAALPDLGLDWLRPYDAVHDGDPDPARRRWFVGGGTNLAWLAAERWADGPRATETALLWEGDDGAREEIDFAELTRRVRAAAAGLLAAGVGEGDRVGILLPMVIEAQVALLAIARIGAIAVPVFSGYGPAAVSERLRAGEVKLLVTADGYLRRGKRIGLLDRALEAVAEAPTVERTVVVGRLGEDLPGADAVESWDELLGHGTDGVERIFDTDTPYLLMFTSGSTGPPKGTLHTHGGLPYRAPLEQGYCLDLRPGDRLTWVTDMGWVMGALAPPSALSLGASFLLNEGGPDYPKPDRMWELIEAREVTHLGLSPTLVRQLKNCGDEWVENRPLPTLRAVGSTGEPWTSEDWRWMHRQVCRGRVPIVNLSGGTEIGCCILAGSPVVETPECQFSGPSPGMAAAVFDPAGERLVGEVGELVLTDGWPSKTAGLWRDEGRYDDYWSHWPGVWLNGDRAIEHESGCWELLGRSDDVLKLAGKRTGPVEIEGAAAGCPGVETAAAVGLADAVKGQALVVVVVPADRDADRDALAQRVSDRVAERLGGPLRPARVVVAAELPTSRSGKVLRRLVRAWLSGEDPGDLSTLQNPDAERAIRAAARGPEEER
jgi:acetyl-CoA synthetase